MTWYGNYNESSKQLESFLSTKPSLSGLLINTDIMTELSKYNAKLLDYLTNCPSIGPQIVTYISVPPSEGDTADRKYKLPLLTMMLLEADAPCILNALLKPIGPGINSFLLMFDMLKKPEVLPLLAGYFNRTNLALCRTKYKQTLESVYSSSQYFQLLVEHSYNENIANCLTFYLCIDTMKNILLAQDKAALALGTVRTILDRIDSERVVPDQKSNQIIQNLFLVVREIVEKYYLIVNGKQMLEIALEEKYAQMVVSMIGQESEHSFPAMNLALSFLKYYSLSAMNTEDADQEKTRKNMEKLETQPFIKIMLSSFKSLLGKIRKEKNITLYSYHLLQVLCHFITLSSPKVLITIKQAELFPTLIDLLFKNEQNNILHKLVERTFLHIFSTEKTIYQQYKQYLFCEISLIDLTAKRLLELYPGPECLQKSKTRGYFGVLIKIIKIYSSIVTTNAKIRQAITLKTDIWNRMSKKVLKPYEASCVQNIGQFQNVPETVPVQFTVRKIENQIMQRLIQNSQAIEQIKKQEETMPKTLQLNDMKKEATTLSDPNSILSGNKIEDDSFFKSPLEDSVNKSKGNFDFLNNNSDLAGSSVSANPTTNEKTPQIHKRSTSFTQFLASEKVKVGEELKLQRSQSGEKRLSADKKTRLTSQSPSRKMNNWAAPATDVEEKKEDRRIALTKDLPKIPNAHRPSVQPATSTLQNNSTLSTISNNLTTSSHEPNKLSDQDLKKMTTSMPNLNSLKNVTVVRTTEQPAQKKYRKVQEKDKLLFDFLGLKY